MADEIDLEGDDLQVHTVDLLGFQRRYFIDHCERIKKLWLRQYDDAVSHDAIQRRERAQKALLAYDDVLTRLLASESAAPVHIDPTPSDTQQSGASLSDPIISGGNVTHWPETS